MADVWGSGDGSWREKMERASAEILRRVKVAARNDAAFVPPGDDVSIILAARHYVVPTPQSMPLVDDANAILAARIFLRGAVGGGFGVLVNPHFISPVVDSGTLTMNDAIVFSGSPTSPAATARYLGNGSGSLTDLAQNVPTGGKHSWFVNAAEVIRVTVAGIKSLTGKYFGASGFFIRNDADSADNVAITDAGVMTVRAGLIVTAGSATATTFVGALTGNASTATALAGSIPVVAGSRGGNAALASLLTALAGRSIITDSTTV